MIAHVSVDEDRKIKVGATMKSWIAILVAVISIGFSVGLWAASDSAIKADIKDIKQVIKVMPPPERVANKEMIELQFKMIQDTLVRIEGKIDTHLENTGRTAMRAQSKPTGK